MSVKQNWAHAYNFKNLVDLIAEYVGQELQRYF